MPTSPVTVVPSWTVPPPFTVVGLAVIVTANCDCAVTVTVTVTEVERAPAPSSVAVSVSMTVWAASVASGAVQRVSSAPASLKEPPPSLVQA